MAIKTFVQFWPFQVVNTLLLNCTFFIAYNSWRISQTDEPNQSATLKEKGNPLYQIKNLE
jgi:hypothetical protein